MKNVVNSVRFLGVDAINKANSGHPGIVLGAAPMITELFVNHLNATPENDRWANRDRFVLAAGHGSALLYSVLHHAGYDISMEDMKNFRQLKSKTPGHPEFGHTHGIDATSGPLGQGIAQATGMAVAEQFLSEKYNKPGYDIFNHYTFALCGDGDLQEGVTLEAMSFAGHFGLGKLIVLYDSNDIQLDGSLSLANSEDWKTKCKSMKWQHILVEDGEDTGAIAKAIKSAKKDTTRPTMIEIKTIIGKGCSKEGKSDTHGAPIGKEERDLAAKNLGYNGVEFKTHPDAIVSFKKSNEKTKTAYNKWNELLTEYQTKFPTEFATLEKALNGDFTCELDANMSFAEVGSKSATRNIGGKCIEEISKLNPHFIGGSADLTKSTKAKGCDGNFPEKGGRNINFGVREFAMTAISNGMSLHGHVKPFTGAFFVFSDYAKPAIRMAAIQKISPIYVYTHDSIAVGEDGATHQPIEQLDGLRVIPNVNVIRPADANETIAAFHIGANETTCPTVIALTRQDVEVVTRATVSDVKNGAYIVKRETKGKPALTIIATGSEVGTVMQAIAGHKYESKIRVVSMPSTNLFDKQSEAYKKEIIPSRENAIFIEMSSALVGHKYAQNVYSINKFGESGKDSDVIKHFGFDINSIKDYINKCLG